MPDTSPEETDPAGLPPPTQAPTTVATTVAPTTTVPATTTTLLLPPGGTLAIGDSVMLGAVPQLTGRGIVVAAEKNRQMNTTVPFMQGLRDNGTLDGLGVLVIHLGTNGPISDETFQQFFATLDQVPRVLVLTARASRPWVAANNQRIFGLPGQYPNVELIDWGGLSNACPGACFYDDNIHLRPAGAEYYAQLVQDFIDAGPPAG